MTKRPEAANHPSSPPEGRQFLLPRLCSNP